VKKSLQLLSIALIFAGCTCSSKSNQNTTQDSTIATAGKKPAVIQPVDTSNDGDEPTFAEVLADLRASYNKIEKINKQAIDGKDTIQLHETYYCLHDSSLRVPGAYMRAWGKDSTKDFVANNFVSKLVIIKNRDTVFNKIITKSYFADILDDQLKKYAIIFDAGCMGYNQSKGGFMFGYSISIPLTDLGTAVHLIIDKNGKPNVIDNFTFINKYHEKW
jgi:hypothetical protein